MIPHQPPLAGQLLAFRRFAQYALIHVETACLGADWLLLAEGDMLREDFDGDGAVQAGVPGFVDLAHAAFPEQGGDVVRSVRGGCRRSGPCLLGRRGHSTPKRSTAPAGAQTGVCRSALPIPARWRWWRRRWSWFWWWWYVEPSVTEEGGDVVVAETGAGTQGHDLSVDDRVILRPSGERCHFPALHRRDRRTDARAHGIYRPERP